MEPRAKRREAGKTQSLDIAPARAGRRQALDFGLLSGHLGYFLRRLQVEVFKDFIRTLAPFDLRPGQYSLLLMIAANPGRSQAELGDALDIERAGVAKMLNELERRGWIQRLAAVNDGRSHSIFLTPEGQRSLEQIRALSRQHETRMTRLVGTRRRQELMKLLRDFG
jgi:DNA-binding MarR family transcriptional regulator